MCNFQTSKKGKIKKCDHLIEDEKRGEKQAKWKNKSKQKKLKWCK